MSVARIQLASSPPALSAVATCRICKLMNCRDNKQFCCVVPFIVLVKH